MRVLVIGGSGLVGSHVLAEAKKCGHTALGVHRSAPQEGIEQWPVEQESHARGRLRTFRPDWVVYAAGWTWVDGCEKEPERAFRENHDAPVQFAKWCQECGGRFAYFSSSYVFDGFEGPYDENARPNPINAYGRSKWAAEQGIQKALHGSALIPRLIWVWGKEERQKNFAYQAIRALRTGKTLVLPSDQSGNPTWAGDIASWTVSLMDCNERGVWNLAGEDQSCTREKWFCAIRDSARTLGLAPQSKDRGYSTQLTSAFADLAPRPLHVGVTTEKIQRAFPRKVRAPGELALMLGTKWT